MQNDQKLYEETLELYNQPAFAAEYATAIEDRVDLWIFDEFMPHVPAGGAVLDVASAGGRDSAYLRDRGFNVTGIDYSQELTELAREKHPDIAFVQGDFTDLPFEDESFDGVWCKAALVHLPSQDAVRQALAEFWRTLKPGGTILAHTKGRLAGEPETTVRTDSLSGAERFFRFQTEEEFLAMLKSVGFEIRFTRFYNEQDGQQSKNLRDENWLTVVATKVG